MYLINLARLNNCLLHFAGNKGVWPGSESWRFVSAVVVIAKTTATALPASLSTGLPLLPG